MTSRVRFLFDRPDFLSDPRRACLDADQKDFFPEDLGRSTEAIEATHRAKALCAVCPFMVRCREWAIETHQDFGVWGGTTRSMRRRCRIGRCSQHPEHWKIKEEKS